MKGEKIKRKKKVFICNRCGRNDFINGHALGGHKKYCSKPEYSNNKKIIKRKKKQINNFVHVKKIKMEKKPKNNIVNLSKKKFHINIDELYENLFEPTDDLLNDYNKFKFPNDFINYELDEYNALAKELGF